MMPALPFGTVIAVLGAESTGKTELARAIAARLARRGVAVRLVPEYLREWCDREQRTPRADEQAAIAVEQTRRIETAAARGVAIADTTAVMTAVYSDLLFGDTSLYPDAFAAQRGYAITLLTALDLPWVADGLQRDGPQVREPVDAAVRATLQRAAVPYAVVHGDGPQRLANAWNAITRTVEVGDFSDAAGGSASDQRDPQAAAGAWRWSCDKCSDPACEHRLFSDLVASRR
ncbi:MAG: ATP-binding protein [Pseudomonadota bacterium]